MSVGQYGFGGFGGKISMFDADFLPFLRNTSNPTQIIRNDAINTIAKQYSPTLIMRADDLWTAISVGVSPDSTVAYGGISMVTGNNNGTVTTKHELWTDKNLLSPVTAAEIAGLPLPFPSAVAPAGWLKCNGQQFDTAQYPVLASRYPSGFLPDLRGEFVRGWDDGRGIDAGRALMSAQGDAIRNITGSIVVSTENTGSSSAEGAFSITGIGGTVATSGFGHRGVPRFDFDTSRVVPTANENRTRNIAFNYIVRAA
ncbi:DNA-packaging protein [Pectobacterium aquaticum]|uniref:DNA-packaging protein n=2 Tax=Pectobacterium aquaticum TaxID=2204145 RepID=A0AA93DKQ5_9GAMM|nr:DNA-packaging protein [Pectobacterium aquaticum]